MNTSVIKCVSPTSVESKIHKLEPSKTFYDESYTDYSIIDLTVGDNNYYYSPIKTTNPLPS